MTINTVERYNYFEKSRKFVNIYILKERINAKSLKTKKLRYNVDFDAKIAAHLRINQGCIYIIINTYTYTVEYFFCITRLHSHMSSLLTKKNKKVVIANCTEKKTTKKEGKKRKCATFNLLSAIIRIIIAIKFYSRIVCENDRLRVC